MARLGNRDRFQLYPSPLCRPSKPRLIRYRLQNPQLSHSGPSEVRGKRTSAGSFLRLTTRRPPPTRWVPAILRCYMDLGGYSIFFQDSCQGWCAKMPRLGPFCPLCISLPHRRVNDTSVGCHGPVRYRPTGHQSVEPPQTSNLDEIPWTKD